MNYGPGERLGAVAWRAETTQAHITTNRLETRMFSSTEARWDTILKKPKRNGLYIIYMRITGASNQRRLRRISITERMIQKYQSSFSCPRK
jgi:hypothetical protein